MVATTIWRRWLRPSSDGGYDHLATVATRVRSVQSGFAACVSIAERPTTEIAKHSTTVELKRMIRDQIKRLLEIHATLSPPLVSKLLPPVPSEKLDSAEVELGLKLPVELREMLMVTNGQDYFNCSLSPFIPGYRFADCGWEGCASYGFLLGIEEIVQRTLYTREQYSWYLESPDEEFELTGPVKYHDRFIDFTGSFNSDNLVLDMMPENGGHVGQVVMMRTQPCQLAVITPGISALLDKLIEGFLSDRFQPVDEAFPAWWDGGFDDEY